MTCPAPGVNGCKKYWRNPILWQRVFNALAEGVMVATPDQLMMDMNPASQTMLGYSLVEVAGQPTEMPHADYV